MYYTNPSYAKRNLYNLYKKFSLSTVATPFFASYPGYPSYLGIKIFSADEKYMGKSLLGFTNGNFIVIRKGLGKILRLFVQFHEEEHVKDMQASEKVIDQRALKRLIQRNILQRDLKEVRSLLRRRWHNLSDFQQCELHNFSLPSKSTAETKRKTYYMDWKFDIRF